MPPAKPPLQRMALEVVRQNGEQETWAELKRRRYGPDFLIAGPILRALQSEARAVLLIDEVDKLGPRLRHSCWRFSPTF